MTNQYWIITLMLFMVTVITRTLPFLFGAKMTDTLNQVGKLLPGYIMMCLVIYEINPHSFFQYPYGLPDLIGLLVVLILFKTVHNMVLSLFLSFITYMLCLYWF